MAAISDLSDVHVSANTLHIRDLRYPTEPSRFALAVVSAVSGLLVVVVWLAQLDLPALLAAIVALAIALSLLWVTLQIHRVRILGDAVLVGPDTLPEFQTAVDEVRNMVDYHKRVDIFVVPKLSPPTQLTSYFGVRVLLVEGGAVADITTPANRPQLLFLLGTYFGALKAKHDRWTLFELLLDNAGMRRLLAPVVGPWLRATVYTGDRIAFACSRDFGTSLDAVFRTLVGRELSPQLEAGGLIKQADRVRRSLILRFAQQFRPVPHATNRFLSLVHFAARVDPESASAFRAALPEDTKTLLDRALTRASRDERRTAGAAMLTAGAVAVAALLIYAGFQAGDALRAAPNAADDVVSNPTPEPIPAPGDTTLEPTPAQTLINAVPDSLGAPCSELAAPAPALTGGLIVAVSCVSLTADFVQLYAYDSLTSMASAVDQGLAGLGSGVCPEGGRGTWNDNDVGRGTLACFVDPNSGRSIAMWTYDDESLLVVAGDTEMRLDELYVWWQQVAPPSVLG